jgi:hypothetical protein
MVSLDPEESQTGVQLIAITMNGVRLYFSPSTSAYSFSYAQSPSATGGWRPLQLIHVRLPPNLLHPDEQSSPHRPHRPSTPHEARSLSLHLVPSSCQDLKIRVIWMG